MAPCQLHITDEVPFPVRRLVSTRGDADSIPPPWTQRPIVPREVPEVYHASTKLDPHQSGRKPSPFNLSHGERCLAAKHGRGTSTGVDPTMGPGSTSYGGIFNRDHEIRGAPARHLFNDHAEPYKMAKVL